VSPIRVQEYTRNTGYTLGISEKYPILVSYRYGFYTTASMLGSCNTNCLNVFIYWTGDMGINILMSK
jgi:hypothetical protein